MRGFVACISSTGFLRTFDNSTPTAPRIFFYVCINHGFSFGAGERVKQISMNNSNEVKQCPYCGKEILAVAKKCKHCGKWLNETNLHEQKQPEKVIEKSIPKTTNSSSNSKLWMISCIIEGVIIVALLGCFFLKNDKYYLVADSKWTPNSDFSRFITIVSDDKADAYPAEKGWSGNLMLAVSKGDGGISPILSSDEVCRSKEFHELTNLTPEQVSGLVYSFYPSTQLADVVYFAYTPMYSDGSEDFSIYGKINIHTKEFTLYPGNLWGTISKGQFANSYLCEQDKMMYIYPQSKSKELEKPITTFKLSDYMQYEEGSFYDPDFQKYVIQWLEEQ